MKICNESKNLWVPLWLKKSMIKSFIDKKDFMKHHISTFTVKKFDATV